MPVITVKKDTPGEKKGSSLPRKILDFEPQQQALAGYEDGQNLTAHIQSAQVQHIYCNLQHTAAAVSEWQQVFKIPAYVAGTLGGKGLHA